MTIYQVIENWKYDTDLMQEQGTKLFRTFKEAHDYIKQEFNNFKDYNDNLADPREYIIIEEPFEHVNYDINDEITDCWYNARVEKVEL